MEELVEQKNKAYWERNQLVCAFSKIFPSWLERHPEKDKDWEDDWRNIVFINFPGGQCSWHIHDSEFKHFKHLRLKKGDSWDGHTVEEKYKRIQNLKNKKQKIRELKLWKEERINMATDCIEQVYKKQLQELK